MSHQVPDRVTARRVFLLLTVTRWSPVGLVIGLFSLVALQRGLTVPEVLTYMAAQGVAIVLLELPTSGFADAFGRRPVLLVAGVVNVVAAVAYLLADSFWSFAGAALLMGVYRALDSGPLESWFVDTVHASEPGADVDQELSQQGTLLGLSIAAAAVLSGALIAWDPVPAWDAFTLPLLVYVVLCGLHLVATALLLHEPPRHQGGGRAWDSVRETPRVVLGGVRLVRGDRVLLALVCVELFWGTAMVVFETFQPIRLAELLGGEARAGAWGGPVAAVGWGVFAAGAHLSGRLSRRLGVARTAIVASLLNAAGAVVMGLVAGPVALVAAYLLTYTLHGTQGPAYAALLHRQASSANRTTILSFASLTSFAASAVMGPVLGHLAGATSTQVAMVTGGAIGMFGALMYVPARRQERERDLAAPVSAGAPQEVGEHRTGGA